MSISVAKFSPHFDPAVASKNVLIVDDDMAYANLVSRYVRQKYNNAIIDTCDNSTDALSFCKVKRYDILLVDFNLPDLNGPDFLHKLQSEINDFAPPAIVLTADASASAAGEVLRANAYDFLPKQLVTKESLGRSIKNALAKHRLEISIRQRTVELEQANNALHERSREIREFYQTVSHEVKNPLAANREFVSLVRDKVLGEITNEQAEALDYALASCDQITSHFNDLLEMTRLDACKVVLRKQTISVDCLVKRTMASCARAITDKNITMELPKGNLKFEINVDGNRIIQVLSNLLSNAVKCTPDSGNIKLTIINNGLTIQFGITDSGCGIDEKYIDSIFNRLFQIGEESHDYSGAGLGLGLSIAREIVILHKGRIWVESELGIGSQFYIELPCEINSHGGHTLC